MTASAALSCATTLPFGRVTSRVRRSRRGVTSRGGGAGTRPEGGSSERIASANTAANGSGAIGGAPFGNETSAADDDDASSS